MKFKSILLFITLLSFNATYIHAQERLTLLEAIEAALENNYDIKIINNDLEIARNDVSRANAGMLPVVTGNLTTNNNTSNTTQTLSNGQQQQRNGAKNTSLNYGTVLSWKIFDGFEMFANYDRLKELQKLGEANTRLVMQNTVSNVIINYFNLVRLQQEMKASQNALEISRLRLRNAQNRYTIGRAAKLEVLAAQVDLNTDTTNLLRQNDTYRTAKITLNELMARSINTDFVVEEDIQINPDLNYNALLNNAERLNPSIQSAIINQRIAELDLKRVKANRYPDLSLNTGYNFTNSTSELGFARESQGQGLNYGLSASINIFNGFLQRRSEKNALIEIENSRLQKDQLTFNVNAQLASLYQTYQTNLELVKLEAENLNIAKQNLDITLEKFKIGTLAPLEFREAQRNFIEASARYTNAQYEAKVAETNLKLLSGELPVK